jgi:asparagine synthase (glutamine-hydrolysing)
MARQHVTVALSGDGGDELFAGYDRYQVTQQFWRVMSLMPRALRKSVAAALTAVPLDRWTSLLSIPPSCLRIPQIGDKLLTAAAMLKLDSADALYQRLVSHCEPAQIMSQANEPRGIPYDQSLAKEFPELLERMQLVDLVSYLPDDILTKVDRASMAVALELRVPLLDHRVVEFSWRLPRAAKVRHGTSKWLLRQILYRRVPRALVERPKMGFDIPLGEWLRGPLRNWAEGMLNERRLREAGLLNQSMVGRIWKEHLDGRRNWQDLLWNVLMLESWRERWA